MINYFMYYAKIMLFLTLIMLLPAGLYSGTVDDIRAKLASDGDGSKKENGAIVKLDKDGAEKYILSQDGKTFLSVLGAGWKHAETEDFAFHYRKPSTMKKISEISGKISDKISDDLLIQGKSIKGKNEKIIIYIMDDENSWKLFLNKVDKPRWAAGFARGDEIFLFMDWGNMQYASFSLRLLAHEMSHIILERTYPGNIPLWLNEGFAEYEEESVPGYIKQASYIKRQKEINRADFYDIDELVELRDMPSGGREDTFYLQAQRLVSYLYKKHGKEKFLKFINIAETGILFKDAVMKVYGDEYKDYKIFKSKSNI